MYISNRAAVYQKKELESERNNDIKQEAVYKSMMIVYL